MQRYLAPLLLMLLCFSAQPASAGETGLATEAADSGCDQAAREWIVSLGDTEHTDIFERHTRNNCEFSGRWVKESRDVTDPSLRSRMCKDLVLIWTLKNCSYFRDVINPGAYEPCKAWSREMHQRCLDNDVNWFP